MNPYLWVFIVLLALDAFREELQLPTFSSLAVYIYAWATQWIV
ncbi:KPN_01571 family protein [Enterobacter sp. 2VL]